MNVNPATRDAETVVEIAAYLEELKTRALAAPDAQAAIGRGYLTPSEEISLRHMQASYWQCRNALLEVIHGTPAPDPTPTTSTDPQKAAAFLTVYVAAAVLVDAALFLREHYHRARSIRRKLDEPDPVLGVPPWMYETVQHSLTLPKHVWRLLQARRYYQSGRDELVDILSEAPYPQMLEIADRLLPRLRPSLATYLRTRLHVWGRLFKDRFRADVIGHGLFQVQRYVSTLLSEVSLRLDHIPGVPTEVRNQILAKLQPGDVFVVRKEHAVTNYFLPGYWPHAALYVGGSSDLSSLGINAHGAVASRLSHFQTLQDPLDDLPNVRVLEALKDGVRIRSVGSPLASDSIVVLRPHLQREHLAEAFCRALSHEGKPYDFDFDFASSHRMVCTEVVYRAYEGLAGIKFQLRCHAGRMALGAEGLIQMALSGRGFDPELVYSPDDDPNVLSGGTARTVLQSRTPPEDCD